MPSRTTDDLLADVGLSNPAPDNDVHGGYRQAVIVPAGGRLRFPQFAEMLEPLQPVRSAWLSWIEPGGYVSEHIDAGPHYERWQVPLSECGRLIQDGEPVDHRVGVPFRVHHDRWHAVDNRDGDGPRVSLVVDRDVIVSADRSPLRLRSEVPDAPPISRPAHRPWGDRRHPVTPVPRR